MLEEDCKEKALKIGTLCNILISLYLISIFFPLPSYFYNYISKHSILITCTIHDECIRNFTKKIQVMGSLQVDKLVQG